MISKKTLPTLVTLLFILGLTAYYAMADTSYKYWNWYYFTLIHAYPLYLCARYKSGFQKWSLILLFSVVLLYVQLKYLFGLDFKKIFAAGLYCLTIFVYVWIQFGKVIWEYIIKFLSILWKYIIKFISIFKRKK